MLITNKIYLWEWSLLYWQPDLSNYEVVGLKFKTIDMVMEKIQYVSNLIFIIISEQDISPGVTKDLPLYQILRPSQQYKKTNTYQNSQSNYFEKNIRLEI